MSAVLDKIRAETPKKNGQLVRARVERAAALTKNAKKLIDLLTDRDLKAVVKVWRDGLLATKSWWNPAAKEWVTEPDWGRRYDFSMAIVAYVEGKPIERSMELKGSYKELSQVLEELKLSPEARRLLPPEIWGMVPNAPAPSVEEKPVDQNPAAE